MFRALNIRSAAGIPNGSVAIISTSEPEPDVIPGDVASLHRLELPPRHMSVEIQYLTTGWHGFAKNHVTTAMQLDQAAARMLLDFGGEVVCLADPLRDHAAELVGSLTGSQGRLPAF